MAAKKKTKRIVKHITAEVENPSEPSPNKETPTIRRRFTKRNIFIVITVIVLAGAISYYKGLVLAALVNGEPISRISIIRQLEKQNGRQALDSIITETLINQEAKKKNITVTDLEVANQIKSIEENLKQNNQDINQVLSMQGMTMEDLKNLIKVRQLEEKLIGKDIQVSDSDIDNFIKDNKDYFPATMKPDEVRANAKSQLMQQKLSDREKTWIADLRAKAKVTYFVNY
jgi:foldase protein PrsA